MIVSGLILCGCSMEAKTKKVLTVNSKDVIILAMHGVPANDTPEEKVGEYHKLHGMMKSAPPHVIENIQYHFEQLDSLVRYWPRTPENDPYYFGTKKIADEMAKKTGATIFFAFNEFCAPDLPTAFQKAADHGAKRITVITAMLTPGGNHAEIDIPKAIEVAKKVHPNIEFNYAWPFGIDPITDLLVNQIASFIN